jgi:hypothetical protein
MEPYIFTHVSCKFKEECALPPPPIATQVQIWAPILLIWDQLLKIHERIQTSCWNEGGAVMVPTSK